LVPLQVKNMDMEIHRYIAELLSAHDCVIIPGLGGFVSSYLPAQIHPVYHTFQPPSKKVLFNVNLRQNDGLLANHIVQKEHLSFSAANEQILRFSEETLKALKTRKYLILPQIGKLYMGREDNIQFEQDLRSNHLPDSFGLEPFFSAPVSRDSHHERNTRKVSENNWNTRALVRKALPKPLKWAAILAVPLAVTAILSLAGYDTIKNGTWNTANIFSSLSPFENASRTGLSSGKTTMPKAEEPLETNRIAPANETLPEQPGTQQEEQPNNQPAASQTDDKPESSRGPLLNPEPRQSGQQNSADRKTDDPSSGTTQTYRFAVIVGAFSVQENAENLVAKLLRQGYQATIIDRNGRGLTRVAAGLFPAEEQAVRMMNDLKSSGYPGAWVFEK